MAARARSLALAGTVALALPLTGCPWDSDSVDAELHTEAASTVHSFFAAVARGSWGQACSPLTLGARIELEARVKHREDRRSRPSCGGALSSKTFRKLCAEPRDRARSTRIAYRGRDVTEEDSKPTVAWGASTRARHITSPCELRLTRDDSDDVDWRIDAIALKQSQIVLDRARDQIVFLDGDLVPLR